ncbi:MAG TPA: hypothetical protein VFE13_14275 [Caulobacteraceae bacterium]|jgi:hypothetical protein|nr:hypothetical protein [Caulobacteraceae bacterium]
MATNSPPTSFSRFKLAAVDPPPAKEPVRYAAFALNCASCNGGQFHVGSFPVIAPDPSPYYKVAPGQTIDRPPHRLRCAGCGATEVIFDTRSDGYDGKLNGGGRYESGEAGETFTDAPYEVIAYAVYNIGLEELEELAPRAGPDAKPSDLFDWFNLLALPVGSGTAWDSEVAFEWDYRCG